MDDERKGSPWIAWCSGIVVLLGLYVGLYAYMLEPREILIFRFAPAPELPIQKGSGYRVEHPLVDTIFVPIEHIDRRVRTDFWDSGYTKEMLGREPE